MSLQKLIDRLLLREAHFFTFLEDQAKVALQASEAMLPAIETGADHEAIRAEVRRLEKVGDGIHGT